MIHSLQGVSDFGEHEHADPINVVFFIEMFTRQRAIEPTSLLLLNLGSVLTNGSFRTNAFLLSLKPSLRSYPLPSVHTELWQALAAPLRIVVLLSQDEIFDNAFFYGSDFIQNIRHKFVFLLITRTQHQNKELKYDSEALFSISSFIWSGRKPLRWMCYENRDNLFFEQESKSINACNIRPTSCDVEQIRETTLTLTATLAYGYQLDVKCNTTRTVVPLQISLGSFYENLQVARSLLNVVEDEISGCLSFIPLVIVDVTALFEPFDMAVWTFILMHLPILGVACALIARESATVFATEISLSIVTVRELPLYTKNYSTTILGCAALAFSFLIGSLYGNTVMSSFLDPTSYATDEFSVKYPPENCRMSAVCYHEDSLYRSMLLGTVCNIPRPMLETIGKPSRAVHLGDRREQSPFFYRLESRRVSKTGLCKLRTSEALGSKTNGKLLPVLCKLILVPSQSSWVIKRIIEHGIVSPTRLRIQEAQSLMEGRSQNGSRASLGESGTKALAERMKRGLKVTRSELEYVSFNTTNEAFDMDSFLKIQPMIGACCVVTLGAMIIELCCWKRSSILSRVARGSRNPVRGQLYRTVRNGPDCAIA